MKPEKACRRMAIVALDFIQEKKTARGAGGYGSPLDKQRRALCQISV